MALCDELVLILDAWRLFGGVLLFLQSRSRCRTLSTREARAAPCVVTIRILHLKHKYTRYRNTRQEVSDYQSVLFYFCFIFYVIYYCLNLNNIPYYIPFFYSPSFFHFLLFCKY